MRRTIGLTTMGLVSVGLLACSSSGDIGYGSGGGSASGSGSPSTGTGSTGTGVDLSKRVDKIDIVLGIDNSRSMADKQEILSLALADLMQSLTNPPCLDSSGVAVATQPATGLEACPSGSQRQFAAIDDIHVGVVTTSLGGHGSDSCPAQDTASCPNGAVNTTNDDRGHLVSRSDPCGSGNVPTYESKGFLSWDPKQEQAPPGAADFSTFAGGINDLVLGAGQLGCGYESQLESWYRFLVEPDPYDTLTVPNKTDASQDNYLKLQLNGTDATLLAQRTDFLRPDSLVAILMLSDENDCSMKEYGQFWFAAQQRNPSDVTKSFYLPMAREVCQTNPNDPCCVSCGQNTPPTCQYPNPKDDPACQANAGQHTALTDDPNLRCWDEKRRFGIDFLYPTDRYVSGLSSTTVPNRNGDMVQNPLFANLQDSSQPSGRDASLVILSGIVGVPWQDLARDPTDLTKGYKSAEELAHKTNGITTWDVILGDPTTNTAPLDPHMIESPAPRSGTDPLTGVSLAPVTAAAGADAINGHEWTTSDSAGAPSDLQYACIFPLAVPRDCASMANAGGCDCTAADNDNPLCQADPTTGERTLQVNAKAYPAPRQLEVIRGLGPQGVVSSICPAQQGDSTRSDYAYRPAVRALIERVQSRLPLP